MLSHAQARALYDRIGAWLDTQAIYENPAIRVLLARGDFEHARAVFEFGCGTGRFAERLLAEPLPEHATYHGVDLSPKMVQLSRARLERFGSRVRVEPSDGSPYLPLPDRSVDRCISTYVLDLLPENEIRAFVGDARRCLAPDGRLCLVSLTSGRRGVSRLVTRGWSRLHAVAPALVGGCRPIELRDYLSESAWRIEQAGVVTAFAVPSEVVVATPR